MERSGTRLAYPVLSLLSVQADGCGGVAGRADATHCMVDATGARAAK